MKCKWAERVGRRDSATISRISREINQSSLSLGNKQNFILCNTGHSYPVDETTIALNLGQFLERI